MKISISVISILIFFSIDIFSQEFKLTDEPGNYFTVDHFADEVYFIPWYSNLVKKINLENKEISETNFPNLPVFMHHSHSAVYHETTSSSVTYFLYDFSDESVKQILHDNFTNQLLKTKDFGEPYYSISPEDTKLLLYSAFDIFDSTWLPIPDSLVIYGEDWPQVWSSDASFIFKASDNSLAEYNFSSNTVDTLVVKDIDDKITGFDYNLQHNILAYSTGVGFSDEKLFIFDMYTKTDKLIFNPSFSDPNYYCRGKWVQFDDLKWSRNWDYLTFLGYDYTNPGTGIHIYDLLADSIISATICDHYGSKQNVEWINNDSILYTRIELDRIYGYNLTSIITSVDDAKSEIHNLSISNYPNPFNPSTKIVYSIPKSSVEKYSDVGIDIYNILGKKVITLVNENQEAGTYEIIWNGKNGKLENISSGIYFARINVYNKGNSLFKSLKMIYLK